MLISKLHLFNKADNLEVLLFTRHMSTMIKSGIPIAEILNTLAQQTKDKRFKRTIFAVLKDVENGQPLSKTLSKYPNTFSRFYVSLIEVSEESGTLDKNLEFIALQLNKNYTFSKKVQTAMLYPTLVFIATVILGSFIAFFILPQLVDFFSAFDIELPITTRILLFFSTLFKQHGLKIGVGLLSAFLILKTFVSLPGIKPIWHNILLKLPILGDFISNVQLGRFSRNFGVLIKSGLSISKSIDIVAHTLNNLKFQNDLLKIGSYFIGGLSISESMEKGKFKEFPPLVTKMLAVGEKTGSLDDSLLYLADFYEEEIDNFSKNITTILEPLMLIVIGLIVGFVALAIITPIYELTGSLKK